MRGSCTFVLCLTGKRRLLLYMNSAGYTGWHVLSRQYRNVTADRLHQYIQLLYSWLICFCSASTELLSQHSLSPNSLFITTKLSLKSEEDFQKTLQKKWNEFLKMNDNYIFYYKYKRFFQDLHGQRFEDKRNHWRERSDFAKKDKTYEEEQWRSF